MVYCGKPSSSCEACRKTKTKCDQLKPSCGQCIRLRRKCPGYRDFTDLLFRDETKKVTLKVKVQNDKSSFDQLAKKPSSPQQIPSSDAPNQLISLSSNIGENAKAVFHEQYCSEMSVCYKYVYPLLQQESSTKDILLNITECIGLAHLSNSHSDPKLMIRASKQYTAILGTVSSEIQHKGASIKDDMIAVVLMLSLFETATALNSKAFVAWGSHINGAKAIAEARGSLLVEGEISKRIITHLREFVMLFCLQRRQAVPKVILDLAKAAHHHESPLEHVSYRLFEIISNVCSIREKELLVKDDNSTLLSTAFEIDDALENWVTSLPDEFSFTCVIDCLQISLDGYYHRYENGSSGRLLNVYRATRLVLHELISRQLSSLSYVASPPVLGRDHTSTQAILTRLSSEICASIPFYYTDSRYYPMNSVTAQSLIWPLYVVATVASVTMRTRAWIIMQLRDISQKTANLQGLALANALSNTFEITTWDRKEGIQGIDDDDQEIEW